MSATRLRIKSFWDLYRKNGYGLVGLCVIVFFVALALTAPLIVPDPWKTGTVVADILQPPSLHHPFGTDDLGRDLLDQVIYGSRISLFIGLLAALVTVAIGASLGLLSGYYSGVLSDAIMTATDTLLCVPWLPLTIILAAILGPTVFNIVLVISVTTWPSTTRVVRSITLSIKERPFVERARALGCSEFRILIRHVLPNTLPLVSANAILIVSTAIMLEATLSFLGLGDPTQISWGIILNHAFLNNATVLGLYWFVLPPGMCLLAVILGFYFMSFSLDEIINPRLRRS